MKKIKPEQRKQSINLPYGARPRIYAVNNLPSMTKQSFKEECDVNRIINQFKKTGLLTHENHHNPQYGYAHATDFRDSMEIVRIANEQFQQLDADIRAKFGNSPESFLAFAENPENEAEMVSLGLMDEPDTLVPEIPDVPPMGTKEPPEPPAAPEKDS